MLCPTCKSPLPDIEDQSQTIEILESQVRQLSQKLAFAVDKAADLEDDLRAVRTNSPASTASLTTTTTNPASSSSPEAPFPSTQSRFTAFINSRRQNIFGAAAARTPTPTKGSHSPAHTASTSVSLSLDEQLQLEKSAREQAEEKVANMALELEELSQSLFEEANAMVRTEREKCARLEARLQIMEGREEDKRRRLTELEKAIGRITRVRNLLENKNASNISSMG